jgi:toxin ParE1/3/4
LKQLRVTGPAQRDLDGIWLYVARESRSAETACRVVDSITGHFKILARSPEAGRRRGEIQTGVRSLPGGNYGIYYREAGPRLLISRVIHGMRGQRSAYFGNTRR